MEVAPSLGRCNEIRQLLARVEHARLHSGLGDPDDLRDLYDRFAVEVDEVDDLAVLRRQSGQGVAQQFSLGFLLQHDLWVVSRVGYP
jgi:hypothetical protein